MLEGKRILLIIGGGIAAYKVLELIRRLKERGVTLRAIMTEAAGAFVTPLAVGALTGEPVFRDLFDLTQEQDIGHIRLSREADLVLVAPATADLMAKMAAGLGGDLATACLLATSAPVMIAPAMNPRMWAHPATRRNLAQLIADGVQVVGPASGKMAERGEEGLGRLVEPMELLGAIEAFFSDGPLKGKHILVTSGPTVEPIDPVRFIANRSSGKQGHAIAAAAAKAGARVTLVSGPVNLADPAGVRVVHVETARQMLAAVEAALPADVAIMAAAVADWRVEDAASSKIKKQAGDAAPVIRLTENPDILKTIGHHPKRPKLVVGFAAETDDVIANGQAKLVRKGADVILANDVSPEKGVFGGDRNSVHVISASGVEHWPTLEKGEVAERLIQMVTERLSDK